MNGTTGPMALRVDMNTAVGPLVRVLLVPHNFLRGSFAIWPVPGEWVQLRTWSDQTCRARVKSIDGRIATHDRLGAQQHNQLDPLDAQGSVEARKRA